MTLLAILKTIEECNELSYELSELSEKLIVILKAINKTNGLAHILSKKAFHLNEETHKSGVLYSTLIEREVADCEAAIDCLKRVLDLDDWFIKERRAEKLEYYIKTKGGK